MNEYGNNQNLQIGAGPLINKVVTMLLLLLLLLTPVQTVREYEEVIMGAKTSLFCLSNLEAVTPSANFDQIPW